MEQCIRVTSDENGQLWTLFVEKIKAGLFTRPLFTEIEVESLNFAIHPRLAQPPKSLISAAPQFYAFYTRFNQICISASINDGVNMTESGVICQSPVLVTRWGQGGDAIAGGIWPRPQSAYGPEVFRKCGGCKYEPFRS